MNRHAIRAAQRSTVTSGGPNGGRANAAPLLARVLETREETLSHYPDLPGLSLCGELTDDVGGIIDCEDCLDLLVTKP